MIAIFLSLICLNITCYIIFKNVIEIEKELNSINKELDYIFYKKKEV